MTVCMANLIAVNSWHKVSDSEIRFERTLCQFLIDAKSLKISRHVSSTKNSVFAPKFFTYLKKGKIINDFRSKMTFLSKDNWLVLKIPKLGMIFGQRCHFCPNTANLTYDQCIFCLKILNIFSKTTKLLKISYCSWNFFRKYVIFHWKTVIFTKKYLISRLESIIYKV